MRTAIPSTLDYLPTSPAKIFRPEERTGPSGLAKTKELPLWRQTPSSRHNVTFVSAIIRRKIHSNCRNRYHKIRGDVLGIRHDVLGIRRWETGMKLDFTVDKKTLIVRVSGELDLLVADEFRQEVDALMEKNCTDNIVLNLGGVRFIDSSGLGGILGRYKKVTMRGGKLAIVTAPVQVKRILEMSGILSIAGLYESENEALQAM
ncbi:MAG: anti-sigma factor antagonist [Eubacteriales bacterium]